MHWDDLVPEVGEGFRDLKPKSVATFFPNEIPRKFRWSDVRISHAHRAMDDTTQRLRSVFGAAEICSPAVDDLPSALKDWAQERQIKTVLAYKPFVGELGDQVPTIVNVLSAAGIQLLFLRRQCDASLFPFATKGFFDFWQKSQPLIASLRL